MGRRSSAMFLPASAKLAEAKPNLAKMVAAVDEALAEAGAGARLEAGVIGAIAGESEVRAASVLDLFVAAGILEPVRATRCAADDCQQLIELEEGEPPDACSSCGAKRLVRKSFNIYRLSESGAVAVNNASAGLDTATWSDDLATYKGKVNAAIITIKSEEQDAGAERFPEEHSVRGQYDYGLCRIDSEATKGRLLIATVRQMRQGTNAGNTLASHIIEDLDPQLILVVGIAGASPFGDAVLGDVVLGTHVNDLTVRTVTVDGSEQFSAAGGPATVDIESAIASIGPRLRSAAIPVP